MNKKRTGFTLPEILMTLVIAGFIAVLTVQAVNVNRTAYTSLAYYAFNNLKSAVGELIIPESQGENIIDEDTMEGTYTEMRMGPFGYEERLLKPGKKPDNDYWDLLEWGLYNVLSIQDFGASRMNPVYTKERAENNNITFPAKGDIYTTNGQKYYVGIHVNGTPYNNATKTNGTYGYRIVAIDINGDAQPNSMKGKNSLPPDIISFAVLDSGEVLPLGAAANNFKFTNENKTYNYLTSKINAFRFKDPDGSNTPDFCERTETCDYDKVYLLNETNKKVGFSFREAYCAARITDDVVLDSYCDGINKHTNCPPYAEGFGGDKFDVCKQEIIKPMFRFNFN